MVRRVTQRECRFRNWSAAIVKSFVRIHETNLKKQGFLVLAFDTKYFDRIQPSDRVSLVGLDQFASGKVKSKLKICSKPSREIH